MSDVDVAKIRASGPWVLVKPEDRKKISDGGLYLPDGNLYDRIGYTVARVVSVSEGYWDSVGLPEKKKRVFVRFDIKSGDRVVFRGHLKEANKVGKDHCFMHANDLIGVLADDADLSLSLPYDN